MLNTCIYRPKICTYQCDPHGQCCPINAEVLQYVVFHEAQDGQTRSFTRMENLKHI